MAQQNTRDDWDAHRDSTTPKEGPFKREGPEPGSGDTGNSIEEMNRKAEKSVINNVRPDESVD